MLKSEGHDNTVDWWTLGILLYEMLVGIPPFFHKNKHRMYYLIQEANVTFPVPEKHKIEVLPEAQDLINKLLTKNRTKRIGCGPNGIKEILAHPFFSELDIDAMMNKKLKPDYMPDINEGELKFFDQKLVNAESVDISVIPQDKKKIVDKNKAAFDNF
jgi:serine/threonine protein kinase